MSTSQPVLAACCLLLAFAAGSGQAAPTSDLAVTPDDPLAFQGPSLAIDPVRPGRVAIGFQEGIGIATCYFALSTDGGRRWRTVGLVGAAGRYPLAQDDVCWKPMLAYGPNGVLFYVFQNSFLTREGGRDVMLMISRDGGETFEPPRAIHPQDGANQNWPSIAADPRSGRVYVSWTSLRRDPDNSPQANSGYFGTVQVTSSGDGGTTFAQPVEPDPLHRSLSWGSLLAVGGDGRVHLAYATSAPRIAAHDQSERAFILASSFDGARSFRTRAVDTLHTTLASGDQLDSSGPTRLFALARGVLPGDLYVAWWRMVGGQARIFFSATTDGGASWTAARAVGQIEGEHHQHRPWFAVERSGRVHLVYYDRERPDGPQHVYSVYSDDGGASFSVPHRISDVASDSAVGPPSEATGGYPTFGDFSGAVASSDGLMAAWTDSRRGTRLNAKQDIFVTGQEPELETLHLSVRPRRAEAGRRTRFRFAVRADEEGRMVRIPDVRIRFVGRRARTGPHGRATIVARLRRRARYRARAQKDGYKPAVVYVRAR